MRIAILGTRGIPARYGGFETFAEELSWRLADRGHGVTVYCRSRHASRAYRGVRLVYLPTIRHKYLDTLAHTGISTLDLLFRRADVALFCNGANAIFTLAPRLTGIPTALNVDGLERLRKKWNPLARGWYRLSEWLSTFCPSVVVTDARSIAAYYLTARKKESTFIPYGADTERIGTTRVLEALSLEPGRYFFYVSRMEPENNALLVRRAFERVQTPMKLALVGDAPYASEYIAEVRNTSDPRVVIPGGIYGQGYRELGSHCFAYIHSTEVGGTHPALIEAMGRGALVLYLDNAENSEVAGGVGIAFRSEDDLVRQMERVLAMSDSERADLGRSAAGRVRERYSWDAVASDYERLFESLAAGDRR